MKLNEIREIVAFMKEEGVCELEYTERSTSIRLKLTPPAPPRPWDRFRSAAETPDIPDAAPEAEQTQPEESSVLDMELGEAAEKVRKGAVKAGSVVADKVKAGASFLKSRRDELLAGNTPGAYDVELVEDTDTAPEAPQEVPREETPVVGEVPEYVPREESSQPEENPVKLDFDAAKTAVSKTAEVVVNATKAAVELGAAGVRRGGTFLGDFFRSEEEIPAGEAAPAQEECSAPQPEDSPEEEEKPEE